MKYEFECLDCKKIFAAFARKNLHNIKLCMYCYSTNIQRNYQFKIDNLTKDEIGNETSKVIEENEFSLRELSKEMMEN